MTTHMSRPPKYSLELAQQKTLGLVYAHTIFSIALLVASLQTKDYKILFIAGITTAIALMGGIAFLIFRKGRINLGIWMQILLVALGVPLISLAVKGLGWAILVSVPLAILALGAGSLKRKQVAWSVVPALLSGLAGLILDINGLTNRTSLPISNLLWVVATLFALGLGIFFLARGFPGYSLRTKLSILFLIVALLPLSLLIYINYRTTQTALTEAANSALTSVAEQTGQQIDTFVNNTTQSLENQAQLSIFRDALTASPDQFDLLENDILQSIQVLLLENPDYLIGYFLLNREGTYITGIPRPSQQPQPFLGINKNIVNGLQVALSASLPYISPVLLDPATGTPTIYFASTITTQTGVPLGLLIASYDANILQEIIENRDNTAGEGSYGILYDEIHIQLAHGLSPEKNFRTLVPLENNLFSIMRTSNRLPNLQPEDLSLNQPELEAGLTNSRSQPVFTLTGGENNTDPSQVAVYRLQSRPWSVAFFQAQEIFLAPATQQTQTNLLLGLLFAGISTLIAILSTRLISAPITNLADIVKHISTGDLSVRVPITTRDEIGELGNTFNSMTTQIQTLLSGLESQVAKRTRELERRAVQLQTAAEVAREASRVQELETLLNEAVNLISQRFGFYHAGIFLVDDKKEYAVLKAANSDGGQQMLAHGHRLKVGQVGIVGVTTQTGQPHIALNVEQDQAHFAHAYLPDTRSEMALPLKIGTDIIGALDVQSMEEGAFDDEDISILGVLADQLAVAIRNSQLLSEVQQTVKQLQAAYGVYTERSWREWNQGNHTGYAYRGLGVEPVRETTPEVTQAWKNGQPILTTSHPQSSLSVPLSLRGTTLGVIHLKIDSNQVPEEMVDLVKEIGERLAMALENARLLEDTQRQAARERLVTEITTKIRSTNDPQEMLQTAVSELKQALQAHRAQIILNPPAPDHLVNGDLSDIKPIIE